MDIERQNPQDTYHFASLVVMTIIILIVIFTLCYISLQDLSKEGIYTNSTKVP